MGNCCGQRVMEKEISEAKSIAGLIELFSRRREKLADEVEEIKEYLKDDTKKIKSFNMEGLSVTKKDLEKRIDHLKINMTDAYDRVIQVLTRYPRLPLEETKQHLDDVYLHYLKVFETEKEYETDIRKLEDFGSAKGR